MLFFADSELGQSWTYEQLLNDVRTTNSVGCVCQHTDYYQVLKHIVISMLACESVTLLDGELTQKEIDTLVGDDNDISPNTVVSVDLRHIDSVDLLLSTLRKTHPNWSVTLYTSGTTGRPKKVSHNFASITRNVRYGESHIHDIWGFAYNPTHMAGLQVFLQALLNGNSIVRLFGLPKEAILSQISQYGITHISATPTFYRLLLPCEQSFCSVKRITSGGEKFDAHTLMQLQQNFPNAKLTNVYASTEAGTLLASKGNDFVIKPELENKVKIVDGELFIHGSLLGQSSSFALNNGWYPTGDLIEIVDQSPLCIKFVGRRSEMINVGGYKVSPTEVEDAIRQLPQIHDVRVYSKENRILGKIVCCEIVVSDNQSITESEIRQHLQNRLQEYKIPRLYRFVEHLSVTSTGKVSRQ